MVVRSLRIEVVALLPAQRPRPLRKCVLAGLALLAALSLVAAPVVGWAQQDSDKAPAEAPPEPESIALAEVSVRAEATDEMLRGIEHLLEPDSRVVEIAEQVSETRRLRAETLDELLAFLERDPSLTGLGDRLSEWTRHRDQLDAWQAVLSARATEFGSALESLQESRALWHRTRETAVAERAPPALLQRIRATLDRTADVTERVKVRRGSVLTLQEDVTQAAQIVSVARERIEATEEQRRARLLERDQATLWGEILAFEGPKAGVDDLRASLESDLRNLREFGSAYSTALILQLLLFAVVLNYAYALSRRVSRWTEDDPDLGAAAHFLTRPVSTAMLVALVALSSFHPGAPRIVADLVGLLLLVPVLRVMPPLVGPSFRPLLYAVAALYLVSRLRLQLAAAPLLERLIFTVEVVAAIAFLLWLMRPSRLRDLPAGTRISRVLVVGTRVALLTLLASLAANLFGYVAFSQLLGSGVLSAVYLAVVLFGCVRAVQVGLRVSFHTHRARLLGAIRRRGDAMVRVATRVMVVVTAAIWTISMLELFTIRGPVVEALTTILTTPLSVGKIELSLRDVLVFGLTIAAAVAVSRVIRFVLEEDLFTRVPLRRGVANSIATLLNYIVLLLGFMLALAAAGMDFSRVTLLAGAFGVGIGFGLQDVVNNFISGLILLFERPIQTGDTIEVGGLLGDVRRIGIRSSTVRTVDGAEVIIPNGKLISDQVINWTLSDRRRRIDVSVGVAYGSDPTQVQEILLGVAEADQVVLGEPPPRALFVGFGDSSLDFLLRVWIPRFEEGYATQSALAVAIHAALREAGIQIPFPQRDLHLRSVDAPAGIPPSADLPKK